MRWMKWKLFSCASPGVGRVDGLALGYELGGGLGVPKSGYSYVLFLSYLVCGLIRTYIVFGDLSTFIV